MKLKGQSHASLIALSAAVDLTAAAMTMNEDGTATQRIRVLPMGPFTTRGKGKFKVVDQAHAGQIVATSAEWAGAQDIPFDYDHQLVFGAKDGVGGQAPASGWLKPSSLSVEADGIYGTVEWTADAAAAINAKKYKYVSPVIDHDADGKVNAILMGALTAYPAIDGLTKLAASATPTLETETHMDLTALAASLGLAATATLPEILAAQQAQAAALSAAQGNYTALTQALGLDAGTEHTAALTAAATLKAGGDANTTVLASLQTQLASLTAAGNEREVDAAIAAGRVIPAQRQTYLDMMRTNPTQARALMGSNPVVGEPAALNGNAPGGKITALSADHKKVADMLGVSHDDYLKTLQEDGQ